MEAKLIFMRNIVYCFIIICIIGCTSKINPSKDLRSTENKQKDSVEITNYNLLQEYAVCRCIYSVAENKASEEFDISPSVYANLLNYRGTDTLAVLAKYEALQIKPEKYIDYQNKKATFARCSQWAKSKGIDSIIRMFAKTAADEWTNQHLFEE